MYADYINARGAGLQLIQIMQAGLRASDNPARNKWLLRPSIPEETDSGYVQGWIDQYIYGKKPAKKPVLIIKEKIIPESIASILKTLI